MTDNNKAKQYILVLFGYVFSMLLGFVVNILATRTMIVEDFGAYKATLNATILIASIVNFGFHYTTGIEYTSITNHHDIRRQNTLSTYILLVIYILTIMISAFLFLLFKSITQIDIPRYIYLSPFIVMVPLITYFAQQKFQGQNNMISFVLLSVLPQILLTIFFLLALVLHFEITDVSALLLFSITTIIPCVFLFIREGFTRAPISDVKIVYTHNKEYGVHLYSGSLFSVSTAQLLTLILVPISGLTEYAYLSLGLSLASAMVFIPTTMGTIQFRENATKSRLSNGEILVTILISIVSLIAFILLLNIFVPILLDNEYISSLPYISIFSVYYTLMGIGDYFNRFIRAKGEGKVIRNSAIATGIVLILLSAILIPMFNVQGYILAKISSAVVYLLLMIRIYLRFVQKNQNLASQSNIDA